MYQMEQTKALAIIDMNRCFMEGEEGERLNLPGFGELPVPGAHEIIETINKLGTVYARHGQYVATIGEAHLPGTAHISETPNFINTWPTHGMQGEPGSELHPDLNVVYEGKVHPHFIKGDVVAATPEEDDSYTATNGHRFDPELEREITLPEDLRRRHILKIALAGVAIGDGDKHPLCVDATAMRLREAGFQVTIITDAVKAINPENLAICFENLGKLGVKFATATEAAIDVINTPTLIR